MDELEDVLSTAVEYRQYARRRDRAHYQMALQLNRKERILGIPVIILSTIVGTTIFATLQNEAAVEWRIATGSLSVMAAVLAALQTFFNYGGEAQRHATSADGYARLWRHMWIFELRHQGGQASRADALEELANLIKEMDELEGQSPRISNKAWRSVKTS